MFEDRLFLKRGDVDGAILHQIAPRVFRYNGWCRSRCGPWMYKVMTVVSAMSTAKNTTCEWPGVVLQGRKDGRTTVVLKDVISIVETC